MKEEDFNIDEKQISKAEKEFETEMEMLNAELNRNKSSVNVDQPVMPDACGQWQKEKPNKECVFLTRTGDGKLKSYNYQLWRFEKIDCDDDWYLGWTTENGDEWDDIKKCKFEEYFILEYYDSKHSV